jgi:SNF2 family DNA or RNA helicase
MMDSQQKLDCPYCNLLINAHYIAINKPVDEVLEARPNSPTHQELKQGEYGGPHTKTKALLADLYQMHRDSEEYVERGEAPLKCVVFSEFTSHLDLIQRALDDHGWTYVRIDGTMSLAKRRRVLDDLNTNNQVRILLASIKAAGQGLNLTAASRAFIMEPLWNPAAEAQAVDRIYRIGQKRDVVVKRYQMNDSIELTIVQLQIKKQKLADITVNKNHQALSKKETREEHMKELLALFK